MCLCICLCSCICPYHSVRVSVSVCQCIYPSRSVDGFYSSHSGRVYVLIILHVCLSQSVYGYCLSLFVDLSLLVWRCIVRDMYASVSVCINLYVHKSVRLGTSVCPCVCLNLSVYLICLSMYLLVSIRLSLCQSVCPRVCLSLSVPVCVPFYLFQSMYLF